MTEIFIVPTYFSLELGEADSRETIPQERRIGGSQAKNSGRDSNGGKNERFGGDVGLA
jgi:hypothetical protein